MKVSHLHSSCQRLTAHVDQGSVGSDGCGDRARHYQEWSVTAGSAVGSRPSGRRGVGVGSGAPRVVVPGAGGRLHPCPELAEVGSVVDDGPGSAAARLAAYGGESVDRCWSRHQDGVVVAGSLDGEADAGHVRASDGDGRGPCGHGQGESIAWVLGGSCGLTAAGRRTRQRDPR